MTSNPGNPTVSIIVRTKDRPKLLNRALQSIADQTYRPIEIVLVNDGGCDLDLEAIKNILGDVSLNYVRLEKNMGRAHAGNIGIEEAKGSYIGFLDDDDELYPDHVVTLVSFLIQSDYKVAYTDSLMVYKGFNPASNKMSDIRKELIFSEDFDYDLLVFENYIPFMCLLFKRGTLTDSGGFDGNFELYEDWDLLIRIGEKNPFSHIKKTTADYNQWSSELQISQANNDAVFLRRSYLKIIQKHIGKITPDRIYDYLARYSETRKNEIRRRNSERAHFENRLREFEREGRNKDVRLAVLETEISDKDVRLAVLQTEISDRDAQLHAIVTTRGWRMLNKYRKIRKYIREPFSGVKHQWKLAAKGVNVLMTEGFTPLLQKVNKNFLFKKSVKKLAKPIETVSILSHIDKPISSKVSVIIPTKDAGDEFEYALRKISQQEGVNDIELIIIDSGSKDRTVEISEAYTKNVFRISPEEFHHARTRNLGADKATGDLLVFMVQDAIPIGNRWLYKLLLPIKEGEVSAVSVRQVPRSDTDLFASYAIWGHIHYVQNFLDRICDNTLFKNFDELDVQAKRSMAGLDNVCMGIKKTIFDSYRFKTRYAEDLELGTRLIKDGHALMFQASNAVIHSHNRHPLYFLKRSYVDMVSLSDILQIERGNLSAVSLLEAISCFYSNVKMCISRLKREQEHKKDPGALIQSAIDCLNLRITASDPSWQQLRGDHLLDEYFHSITPVNHREILSEINTIFSDNLRNLSGFMRGFKTIEGMEEDFLSSIYKVFSITAGNYLAANSQSQMAQFFEGI